MVNSALAESFSCGPAPDRDSGSAPPAEEPVLDLVHLSRQTFGDHALETELLTLFDRQAEQFAARLAAPCVAGESGWRADLAHTLKGSARAVGAFGLGAAAEAYESSLRSGDPCADALQERLAAAIGTVRAEIAALFEKA